MRITNNLLIHNMLWNMNNNLVSMNEKQEQLSSGKRIHKPSDDPVGTTRIIKVKSDIAENEQYSDNVRDAKSWLEISENSLTDTKDILQRIRELAVQGANGVNTEEETGKIAKEIDQLIEEVIVNANSTMAGRYLFSGFNTDTPLMNEDGTYNIDITSEKMTDFKAIAYEVAVGEQLEVGTNYLDVYGIVENKNVVTDTFVFGNVSAGESRVGENEAQASGHTRVQGPVDYKKNLTSDTMDIQVAGATFTVDTSKLDGTITQSEYVKILKMAEQTAPPASLPVPVLGDVVEVFFVEGDDPNNISGELVIEAKAFGATEITVNGSSHSFIDNPTIKSGTDVVPAVNAVLQGTFDYTTNYSDPPESLMFTVDGKTFRVDTTTMDGTISEVDFLSLLNNATDIGGRKLSDVATVTFSNLGGNAGVGILNIEALNARDETIGFLDGASGFQNPVSTTGVAPVNAVITGNFDNTIDISGQALTFTLGDVIYTVDTSTMDGTRTEAEVITLLENATGSDGSILNDTTGITYALGVLTITADAAIDQVVANTDAGSGFTAPPTLTNGVAQAVANLEATFEVSDLEGQALTFSFDGNTYTVDTTAPLDETNFEARVQGALNGPTPFSTVATISFNALSGDVGNLSITANPITPGTITINNPALYDATTELTPGVSFKTATAAEVESVVDISTDLNTSGNTLTYTVGGITYAVDASQLDATITTGEFITLIENAIETPAPVLPALPGVLSDVADITYTPHSVGGSVGTLLIESKTAGLDTIAIGGTGDIHVKFPVVSGPEKAKIEGVFDFSTDLTGDTLSFDVDGTTYTVDTTAFDTTIIEADFLQAIKDADDGSGGKLSDVMDVNFNLTAGTSGILTIEEKNGSDAVVTAVDTGGGFVGSILQKDGSVVDTDVVLTGVEAITDAMISDALKGSGTQSFVVSYNDITHTVDIDMTSISTMAEMTTALNDELRDKFGVNSDSPPKNNVQFEIVNDGSKDVVQFTGEGKEDGSRTSLKVDVILSTKPQMIQDLEDFSAALKSNDEQGIQTFLGQVDDHLDNVIKTVADIGAKNNRLDFIENRISDNNLAMTEILSNVQDIDYAEVTLRFKSLESIYRASLSVGAKVIQPTLVDFIK